METAVKRLTLTSLGLLVAFCIPLHAQEATFTIRQLTPETALKLAQATLEACRKEGFQIAVAVTDRAGVAQVILRDRFAGPHTVDVAVNKAWTAVSFRQDTLSFSKATAALEGAGPRHFPRVASVGGGIPITSAGAILGGVGVSGAPGGDADDRCARVGLVAIESDIEF
jgi:uncharacterized protein GlcG (DUF336 family)